MSAEGLFPPKYQISPKKYAYRQSEILAWMDSRPATKSKPPSNYFRQKNAASSDAVAESILENKTMATPKDVFTMTERDGETYWTRLGAAFENRDGSINVLLDGSPVNGKLQIREKREFKNNDSRGSRNS